jgi:tRNA (cmo5U34)-methyltransferase
MSKQRQNVDTNQKNAWDGAWDGTKADAYINSADVVAVERRRLIKILSDLYRYRFGNKNGLMLLDIGCGDGILSKYIQSKSPENTFYLLDGSYRMLEKAKQNVQGPNVFYIHQTFEEYMAAEADDARYDFIYSANAIHHLDLASKCRLYAKIFQELKEGGLFINIDPVLPSSELSEQWQFNMWRDWMNETLNNCGLNDQVDKYNDFPLQYKMKSENKPSSLFDQMQALGEVGFEDVDCFYKYRSCMSIIDRIYIS